MGLEWGAGDVGVGKEDVDVVVPRLGGHVGHRACTIPVVQALELSFTGAFDRQAQAARAGALCVDGEAGRRPRTAPLQPWPKGFHLGEEGPVRSPSCTWSLTLDPQTPSVSLLVPASLPYQVGTGPSRALLRRTKRRRGKGESKADMGCGPGTPLTLLGLVGGTASREKGLPGTGTPS